MLVFCIFADSMQHRYNDFGTWIRMKFPFRVQKISIDAGFSCPNRDGRISYGGCTFCDNRTFNPFYCDSRQTVTEQIEEGKAFFSHKYPHMKYLAYFQAYSNTYAPLNRLRILYEEALSVPEVIGIVVGTRPDCVSDEVLDYLGELSKSTFVLLELGIESTNDVTLRRINRGHTFAESVKAVRAAHDRNILVGGHIILGLPGEDRADILKQASVVSALPLDILKLHQMQIIRGTVLAKQYEVTPFHVFTVEVYITLIGDYIQLLRRDLVLDRFVSQSPSDMLIAPQWGVKNHEFTDLLNNYLNRNNICQGSKAV